MSEDTEGNNIAHYAVSARKCEVLVYLYKNAPEKIKTLWVRNKKGQLPGDLTSDQNQIIELRNHVVKIAKTALILGNATIEDIQLLLELDPFSKDDHGHTLAHLAVMGGNVEIVRYLFENHPQLAKQIWIPDYSNKLPERYAPFKMKEKPQAVLSSRWDQVGPIGYCRQENRFALRIY